MEEGEIASSIDGCEEDHLDTEVPPEGHNDYMTPEEAGEHVDYHHGDPHPPPTLENNEEESSPSSGDRQSHSPYDYHNHWGRVLQQQTHPPHHDDKVKEGKWKSGLDLAVRKKNNNNNEWGRGRVRRRRDDHHPSRTGSRGRSISTSRRGYEGSVRRVDIDLRSKLDGKRNRRRTPLLQTPGSRRPPSHPHSHSHYYDRNHHGNGNSTKRRRASEVPTHRPRSLLDLDFHEFGKAPKRGVIREMDSKVKPEEPKEQLLDSHSPPRRYHHQPPRNPPNQRQSPHYYHRRHGQSQST